MTEKVCATAFRAESRQSAHPPGHDPDRAHHRRHQRCRHRQASASKSEAVIPLEQFKGKARGGGGQGRRPGRGRTGLRRGQHRRDAPVAREGQAMRAPGRASRKAFNKSRDRDRRHHPVASREAAHDRDRERPARLPATAVAGRRALVRGTSYLEGKPLEFKVIKLDQKRNNVVVLARAGGRAGILRRGAARSLDNLQEGAVVRGTVKNTRRLRCVRRPRRHRWPAASPTWRGSASSTPLKWSRWAMRSRCGS